MSSRYPAIVREVDRERREIRVEIPGLTDGADKFPLAEIEYPIGDRSEYTEIRILPGDRVWVDFIAGDPRYPIITGFRAKQVGNDVGTRRWAHDNIELIADALFRAQAGESITLDVNGTTMVITDGKVEVNATEFVVNAKSTFNGDVDVVGTVDATVDVLAAGTSGHTHKHGGVDTGPGQTSPPVP